MIVARRIVECRRTGRGSAGIEVEVGVLFFEQPCRRVREILPSSGFCKCHLRLICFGNAR